MKTYLITYSLPVHALDENGKLSNGENLVTTIVAETAAAARRKFREWTRYLSNGREKAIIVKIERK